MPHSSRVHGWVAVAAALAVLAMVALLVPAPAPPAPVPRHGVGRPEPARLTDRAEVGSREWELRVLLARRATALRDRDLAAFMESVDPKAPVPFRQRQRALFRNLEEVPLTHWSYEIDPADTVPRPVTTAEPAEELWAPRVVLSYALAGVDTVPTSKTVGYLFARRGDSWYLTSDAGLRERGRSTWRGPWYYGMCRVITTGSGLVIGHDGDRELAGRVARILDSSVAAVTEVWGPDWARQVGVVLPGSRSELRALVGPAFAVDGIAAVAVADRVNPAVDRVEGPRIVLNTSTAATLTDSALQMVLRHEITHIAARADTAEGAPMWLLEGFADYVGYRHSGIPPAEIAPDLVQQVRERGPPGGLPSDAAFHLSGTRLDLAYQQSWSVVHFLARRVGERRVVRLYHRIAESGADAEVDAALSDITDMDTDELVSRWGRHLRDAFG